jgi:YVTN family beta-propeller protein
MRIREPIRVVAAVLAALVAFTGGAFSAERVYVLSQTGAALSVIEDGAGKVSTSIALAKAPASFALSPDGTLAYVTHPDLGQVSVVDLEKRSVVRSFDVPGSPFGIAVARDGRVFVGDWNGAHVSVVGADDKVSATIEVGKAPAHILLTPDEGLLVVANRESDSVSVARTDTLAVAAVIPVGKAPFAMALSPDAARLYVGNVQDGSVSVIDMGKLAAAETWMTGAMPYGAAVTGNGASLLVTNQQAGTLAVLKTSDGVKSAVKVGGYPEGVAVSTDGARAYVANWFSDDVSVIDLATLKEVRRVKCPGGPRGIVVSERGP